MADADLDQLQTAIKRRWSWVPSKKAKSYVNAFSAAERRGTKITARVVGNHGTYTVSIQVEEQGLRSACSCYIGKSGHCHHCEALAITFLDDPSAFKAVKSKQAKGVHHLTDVRAYLDSVTLDALLTQLKAKGITQKAFAEQIGMNTRHLAAIKSSELRNHYFNELGATKLACLWMLDHLGKAKGKVLGKGIRMTGEKQLLMTMTGEIHQPIRLYYTVYDQAAVLKAFAKLRCMDDDQDNQRWVWLYHGAAKKLKFHTSYSAIPRKMRPIVLGSFRFTHAEEMSLDVRSWERATQAVVFFDRYLKRSIVQVTHAAIVNQLFAYTTGGLPELEGLFAPVKVTEIHGEEMLLRAAESLKTIQDPGQRMAMAFAMMEQQSNERLPNVEKFPVHFYEDGITSLENALRLRQIVAFEHWQGHTDYTLGDIIRKVSTG